MEGGGEMNNRVFIILIPCLMPCRCLVGSRLSRESPSTVGSDGPPESPYTASRLYPTEQH